MVKRDYRGPPIDGREQWITERPFMSDTPIRDDTEDDGETVGGTSEDDLFSESTDKYPSYLDLESVPDDELDVIGWVLSSKTPKLANPILERRGISPFDVKQIVNEHLKEEHIDRIADYHEVPDVPLDEISPKQRDVVEAYMSHPEFPHISVAEFASEEGYHQSTARRAIHRTFHGLRGFDDLYHGTRTAIILWAYEGLEKPESELHEKYEAISSTLFGEASRLYPDLIAERQPVTHDDAQAAYDEYEQKKKPRKSKKTSKKRSKGSAEPKKEKNYPDGFTECERWFIEEISDDPGAKPKEIGDRTEWANSNYHNTVREYPEEIKRRIEEKGNVDSTDEIYQYILEHTADLGEWDIGDVPDMVEIEPPLEQELEIEMDEEFKADFEDELDVPSPPKTPPAVPRETVVILSGDLSEQAQEHIDSNDDYGSVTQLARDAIRKVLNGEYGSSTEPASVDVRTDTIEAVIELADVEPAKADAIRTLISNE